MSLRSTPAPDRSRSPKWAVTLRRNDRSPSTETTGHDRRNTQVAGEFEDSALLKIFAASGMGVFPAPALVHQQLLAQYGVRHIGALDGVVEHFYGISTERRVVHPLVRRMVMQAGA